MSAEKSGHGDESLVETCKRLSRQLQLALETLEVEREYSRKLEEKYKQLEEQFRLLRKAYFGRRSEKLSDANQMWLFEADQQNENGSEKADDQNDQDNNDDPDPDGDNKNKNGKKSRELKTTRDLRVVEVELIPEVVRNNPEDYERFDESVSTKLEYKRSEIYLVKTIRPKYRLRLDRNVPPVQHAAPVCLLEGGRIGNSIVLETLIGKYIDHQPLYRLSKNWGNRLGVHIPRNTLCHAVEKASELFGMIYDGIRRHVFSGEYAQVDETGIKYLTKVGRGKSKKGYIWTAHSPGRGTYYRWGPGRNARALLEFLPQEFRGVIQTDGYITYEILTSMRTGIRLLACMAHIRRKFVNSEQPCSRESLWYIKKIGDLYKLERTLRESQADPATRAQTRKDKSLATYKEIESRLKEGQEKYPPASSFRQACEYAKKHWEKMRLYIEDGLLEIDNNLVENKIRPLALGRKNWLFIGSEITGDRSAIIYTIIETCRDLGISIEEYLRTLLEELPRRTNQNYQDLLPWEWKKQREASQTPA